MEPSSYLGKAAYNNVNSSIISPSDFGISDFDILDFLELSEDDFLPTSAVVSPEHVAGISSSQQFVVSHISRNRNIKSEERVKKKNKRIEPRVAFITKSELEVMDDGYKWRKYGKKMVKNSPNPRNYYKCSNGGCGVKKRVERDNEDSRYVITTYDGVHNHETPSLLSYNQPYTLQHSTHSSSSSF